MDDITVGYVMRLGSEDNIRRNGFLTMNLAGTTRPPTIGHAGQKGSNPLFGDFADHTAICTKVENSRVFMRCVCELEWDFEPLR